MQKSDTTTEARVGLRSMPIQFDRSKAPKGYGPPVTSVAMTILEPHAERAMKTHGQTLQRLAERGGLSACEAVAIMEDREWSQMDFVGAYDRLQQLIAEQTKFSPQLDELDMPIANPGLPMKPLRFPWRLMRYHAKQAMENFKGRSLEQLRAGGGMTAAQAVAVMEDRAYTHMEDAEAFERLAQICAGAGHIHKNTCALDDAPLYEALHHALEIVEAQKDRAPIPYRSGLEAVATGLRILVNAAAADAQKDPNQGTLL